MKTNQYFLYAATLVGALSLGACSEDSDVIDGGKTSLAALSLNVSNDDLEEGTDVKQSPTRSGMVVNNDINGSIKNTQNLWYANDVVWAYSTKTKTFNKLTPVADDKDTYGQSAMGFTSGFNAVNYEVNERLILINCGDNSGNINLTDDSNANLKLTRATDDNKMVLVYGDGKGIPYSDEGNEFSIRRTSADVLNDGTLVKEKSKSGTSNEVAAFVTVSPKLLIELPAKSDEDVEALSKLTYKIIVTLKKDDDSEGFPKEMTLKFVNDPTEIKASSSYAVFDKDATSITMGDPLKVKFTADGSDAQHTSSSIWNTTADASDQYKGYIFIPIPAQEYAGLEVAVRVEKPADMTDTSVDDIANKTYTLNDEETFLESVTVNSKNTVNKVFKLGAIWNRTSNGAKPAGFLARSSASTGWVVTDND